MSRREYSSEEKAAALAALLEGQGVTKVAEEYNIPEGTIASWKSRLVNGESIVALASEKADEVGDLLVEYLRASLRALRIQQEEVFSDPEWVRQQGANALAILHGVTTDKVVRLLEALGGGKKTEGNE